ncbi:MAG: methylated-DNA--[protein]-cysteine S-methyltransferase [Flavobacteriaceae bacterium]|jgi:methylated-DNA-[protein]-cysteine S-methyltransferase|nr:methylated-DNA--[protein]-cysteine S-methyltransferase [Flavobacteriaceae bacterium]
MEIGYFESDIGILSVSTHNQEVISISFVDEIEKTSASPSPVLQKALKQIEEYFNGKRSEFDFPYRWVGTDFQVKIWKLVSRIPYGTSLAYVKVAQAYGDAKMVRAVGAALAKNPLIILIPCHRVMGSDGSLVGYSAGIDKKRQLLELEGFPKQIAVL